MKRSRKKQPAKSARTPCRPAEQPAEMTPRTHPMTDAEFLAAFEARSLPSVMWTHSAHVRMAWLYLTRMPHGKALQKVRFGIRRLNAALGSDGYHDTITSAYVHLILARLSGGDGPETFDEFCVRNPDLLDRSLAPLLKHYEKETLFSPGAKKRFVEPDREPLPYCPA